MRTLVRALIIFAVSGAPSCVLAAHAGRAAAQTAASPSLIVVGSPSWSPDGQPQGGAELGFSPLSVTQSGVAYSPLAGASAPIDPTAGDDPARIADLPAWASSYFGDKEARPDDWLDAIGLHGFRALAGPVAWALVMVGVALIGGALRGLIMANRRLDRLRSDEDLND